MNWRTRSAWRLAFRNAPGVRDWSRLVGLRHRAL